MPFFEVMVIDDDNDSSDDDNDDVHFAGGHCGWSLSCNSKKVLQFFSKICCS